MHKRYVIRIQVKMNTPAQVGNVYEGIANKSDWLTNNCELGTYHYTWGQPDDSTLNCLEYSFDKKADAAMFKLIWG